MELNENGKIVFGDTSDFKPDDFTDNELRYLVSYPHYNKKFETDKVKALKNNTAVYFKSIIAWKKRTIKAYCRGNGNFNASDYGWDPATGIMKIDEMTTTYQGGHQVEDTKESRLKMKYASMICSPLTYDTKDNKIDISNVTPHESVASFVPSMPAINMGIVNDGLKKLPPADYEDIVHVTKVVANTYDVGTLVQATSMTSDPAGVVGEKVPMKIPTGSGLKIYNVIRNTRVPKISRKVDHITMLEYIARINQGVPANTLGYSNSCHYDGFPVRGKARLNHDCLRDTKVIDADVYFCDRKDANFLCGLKNKLESALNHKFVIITQGNQTTSDYQEYLDIRDNKCVGVIKTGQISISFNRNLDWSKLKVHWLYYKVPTLYYKKSGGWIARNQANNFTVIRDNGLNTKSYQRYVNAAAIDLKRAQYHQSCLVRHCVVIELGQPGDWTRLLKRQDKDDASALNSAESKAEEEEEEEEEEGEEEDDQYGIINGERVPYNVSLETYKSRDVYKSPTRVYGYAAVHVLFNAMLHYATYHYHQKPYNDTPLNFNFSPSKDISAITADSSSVISIMDDDVFQEYVRKARQALLLGKAVSTSVTDGKVNVELVEEGNDMEQEVAVPEVVEPEGLDSLLDDF